MENRFLFCNLRPPYKIPQFRRIINEIVEHDSISQLCVTVSIRSQTYPILELGQLPFFAG